MTRKFARIVASASLAAAALSFTPSVAIAAPLAAASGVKCLVMIDTPWGEICLIPDVLS